MYDGLAQLLGEEQDDDAGCCVPTELLLRRLTARVATELPGIGLHAREIELPELSDALRDLAIDGIVAGRTYPYVFLDGELRWAGELDIDAVFAALAEAS